MEKTLRQQIAARLTEWFESTGWTKRVFARQMGIAEANVNSYLTGKLDTQNLTVALMREGADVRYIFTGEKEETVRQAFSARQWQILTLLADNHIEDPVRVLRMVELHNKLKGLNLEQMRMREIIDLLESLDFGDETLGILPPVMPAIIPVNSVPASTAIPHGETPIAESGISTAETDQSVSGSQPKR